MSEFDVYKTCTHCNGSGEVPEYPVDASGPPSGTTECPECGGDGAVSVGKVDLSDIEDALSDIMDKCNDIFEQVTE